MPPSAISSLQWDALKETWFAEQLQSVFNVPSSKLFLKFSSPWWDQNNDSPLWQTLHTDLPLGDLHSLGDPSSNVSSILQTMFTSEEYSNYWFGLLEGMDYSAAMKGEFDISQRLIEHAQKHLSEIGNTDLLNMPKPDSAIFHQWKYSPYGGAWQVWKPKVDWEKISNNMLKPIQSQNIFIVGSAFAPGNLNLWTEGALHTVDQVIDKYLYYYSKF